MGEPRNCSQPTFASLVSRELRIYRARKRQTEPPGPMGTKPVVPVSGPWTPSLPCFLGIGNSGDRCTPSSTICHFRAASFPSFLAPAQSTRVLPAFVGANQQVRLPSTQPSLRGSATVIDHTRECRLIGRETGLSWPDNEQLPPYTTSTCGASLSYRPGSNRSPHPRGVGSRRRLRGGRLESAPTENGGARY